MEKLIRERRKMKRIFFAFFFLTQILLFSGENIISSIKEDIWDYENTMEFPQHEWRKDDSIKGYDIPSKEILSGILHIKPPIPPHSSWKTGLTNETKRYFRIAFKEPVEVGTIIGNIGNCEVSYLKSGIPHPGDVNDDNQWVNIEDEFSDREFRVVVFPPNVKTTAIRFKFVKNQPLLTPDRSVISGLIILKDRLFNHSFSASVFVENYPKENASQIESFGPHRLIDGSLKEWRNDRKDNKPISPENPSWVILRWNEVKKIDGVYLVNVFGKKIAVDIYTGKKEVNPLLAPQSNWKEVETFNFPIWWRPPYTDFGIKFSQQYETNAIRIRIVEPLTKENPDIAYVTKNGERKDIARIGEVIVFENIKDKEKPKEKITATLNPPVQIKYNLPKDAYVSIVINKDGKRVKNLIANSERKKGSQIEFWDGTDENGKIVSPGEYEVSGIIRDKIKLNYLFSIYWSGKTPWLLPDGTGGWLSDHCAPRSIAIVKDKIFIGAFLAESGDTLIALDMNGNKLWGIKWLDLAGAAILTTDGNKLYVGSKGGWLGYKNLQMVISEVDPDSYKFQRIIQMQKDPGLSGIAVNEGKIYVSYNDLNQIVCYDIEKLKANSGEPEKAVLKTFNIEKPGSLFFEDGLLYAISGTKVLEINPENGEIDTIINSGLDDPKEIFVNKGTEEIFVSDGDKSQCIKVYSKGGKFLRYIGKPGGRKVGKYNPENMSNPKGIVVDKNGRLWVCEEDIQPKRVSLWDSKTGKFIKEYLGGPEYGGGPVWLDPLDKTKAYYKGMEFSLDWDKGTYKLERIYYRFGDIEHGHIFPYSPDRPVYFEGRKFMVYDFGLHTGYIIITEDNGDYVKVLSAFGSGEWATGKNQYASHAKELTEIIKKSAKDKDTGKVNFSFADENGDGIMQPEEIKIYEEPKTNNQVALLFMYWGSLLSEKNLGIVMRGGAGGVLWYITPSGWTKAKAPIYDLSKAKPVSVPSDPPCGPSGIVLSKGNIIFTGIPIAGINPNGEIEWTYPNPWGGVHGSHTAPSPKDDRVIGTLRVIGKGNLPEIGEIVAINGNKGEIYLFSEDGIFLAKLFKDHRIAPSWSIFNESKRGTDVSEITIQEECFGPTFTQTKDGKFYIICGHHHASIVEIEGLESIKRFKTKIKITSKDIIACEDYLVKKTFYEREKEGVLNIATINYAKESPKIDGDLNDWKDIEFYEVKREKETIGKFGFLWDENYFYFAGNVRDDSPMMNKSQDMRIIFKGGDCVDLQMGLFRSPENNPQDIKEGDIRILITLIDEKPKLVIYRYKVPNIEEKNKEIFASPVRSVVVDKVEVIENPDVSIKKLGNGYNIEGKIKWNEIWQNFKIEEGNKIPIDFGVILSTTTGEAVSDRVYWSNKFAGTVSDLPSEVEIKPLLWGWCEFKK